MKLVLWLVMASAGVVVMIASFRADGTIDNSVAFSSGMTYVAKSNDKPTAEIQGLDLPTTIARMRLMPPDPVTAEIIKGIKEQNATGVEHMEFLLCDKLVELSPPAAGITEKNLVSGRLPEPGRNEVLAGSKTPESDRLDVSGTPLTVVGRLRRDAALLGRSYLIPPDSTTGLLFDPADKSVRTAVIVSATPEQLRDEAVHEKVVKTFPAEQYDVAGEAIRMRTNPFLGYLLGQALLCLGGSGFFIGLYSVVAPRVRWNVLREPLEALSRYRRLLWAVHLVYFGLYLMAALSAYSLPNLQNFMMLSVQKELSSGEGALGFAGEAYASGNIPYAALATFVVNMFLGSALSLTLPSCIIPGSGAVVAAFRAFLWGMVLGPSLRLLAEKMLLHSGTLLLEGEGYILATFFALLVPVYLTRADFGSSLLARYGKAVMLNLKGNLLVALVLLVAAIYEAAEVISMID